MKYSVLWISMLCVVMGGMGNTMVGYAENIEDELRREIKRFDQVGPQLYRGAQPTDEGLQLLKEFGIKTIINMRNEESWRDDERESVEKIGDMTYVELPWTIYGPYQEDVFDTFFSYVNDEHTHPIFFHCKRGSERTGVLAALYKMMYEGYTYDEAIVYANKYDIKLIWQAFVRKKIKEYKKRT